MAGELIHSYAIPNEKKTAMKKKVGCGVRNSARLESSGEACLICEPWMRTQWGRGDDSVGRAPIVKDEDCSMFSQHPCKSWAQLYLLPNARGMVWWRQVSPSSLLGREPG